MATSAKRGRPGVVLTVFLLIIVGLYLIMALTKTWAPKLGLDLQGGQTITLTATSENVTPESLELARKASGSASELVSIVSEVKAKPAAVAESTHDLTRGQLTGFLAGGNLADLPGIVCGGFALRWR